MLRNILKPAAAVFLLLLISIPCSSEESVFRKGPYLIYPNDNTKMTVLWQTVKTPKVSFIEWGKQGNPFSNKQEITESDSTEHGHRFSYTITGLKPGTRIFYRVTADGEKEAGLFRTAPEDTADSLTFHAMGDTNTDLADFDTVMSRVFRDMGTDLSSRQHTWLEQDLTAAKKRWKIAVCHEPAWSARGGHANNEYVQKHLHPLFKKHNVQLVISGHNHYYARCVVDGIVYITTGGGGTTLRTPDRDQPYLAFALKTHHFLRIDIKKTIMKITAVGKDGTVIDTTNIAAE